MQDEKQPEQTTDWRPIETASKDENGPPVLLGAPGGYVFVGWWIGKEKAWCVASYMDGYQGYMGGRAVPTHQPTHWMPLPNLPEDARMADKPESYTTVTRDAMWKIIPGIIVYNLIGRYVLWRFNGRHFGVPLPGRIKFADMRAIPFVRTK